MEFTFKHKVNESKVTITFGEFKINWNALSELQKTFYKIGGELTDVKNQFTFPVFVTPQVIEEIVYNTCFECGGLMKDSTALQNSLVSFDDFGQDGKEKGATQSRVGTPNIINVRKCIACGHSHT